METTENGGNRIADPLPVETVVGECDVNSAKGQERRDTHRAALDAYEKGELDGMFAAYRAAVEQRAKAEKMWLEGIAAVASTEANHLADQLHATAASPTEAIRDVALAAIQLAEKVALREL
jgi:hypothetical protein